MRLIQAINQGGRNIFDLLGVRIVNFKRRTEKGGLTLRLCRLRDLPILRSLLASEISPEASESKLKARSLVSFHRWMKSTFQVIYIIEVEETAGRRIVGFAGLYNMKIGQSLWLSLTIFDPKDRRRGYGTRSLELLLDLLQKNGATETVFAEVLKRNMPSLRFLGKLGFEVCSRYEEKFLLKKTI